MGLNRLVTVVHVDVSEGGKARRPALADLLVHSLQDFRPQVVAVVHNISRSGAGIKYSSSPTMCMH
jgi:hypothetical protein